MKGRLKTWVAAAAIGLGTAFAAGPALAAGELKIYNWFDYLPQELIDKFAKEHDVEVTMDTYDSNEIPAGAAEGRSDRLRRRRSGRLHGRRSSFPRKISWRRSSPTRWPTSST